VDHGTAFDIAWQGKADPTSLYSAIRLAAGLSVKESPAPAQKMNRQNGSHVKSRKLTTVKRK
jgi:isocitrate/isopropylmalate dehydrogenase